jgi:hypothetical protein
MRRRIELGRDVGRPETRKALDGKASAQPLIEPGLYLERHSIKIGPL